MASEQDIFCETQLAVTIDDLARNFDNNLQTDIAILDFLKAFDMVLHNKLLHKLEAYGIRGTLSQQHTPIDLATLYLKKSTTYFYRLNNTILKEVNNILL